MTLRSVISRRPLLAALLALLAAAALLSVWVRPWPASEGFMPGDIFVSVSVMDNESDDHAGEPRIIQYDKNLRFKGMLAVKGATHGIGGLAFGPDKTLWAFSQLTPSVLEFSTDGRQKPQRRLSDRSYSSVAFGPDGSLYFGEHLRGKETRSPFVTTRFKLLPGQDKIGDGHVYKHSTDGRLQTVFPTSTEGGMADFLGVTSMVLADNGTRMVYLTETGTQVRQYDLVQRRQLPDLARFGLDSPVQRIYVISALPDGRLIVSTGTGFVLLDPMTGALLRSYDLPEPRGWATVAPSTMPGHVLIGNFMTGQMVMVQLLDGAIVANVQTGQMRSLAGIAQYPGP